MSEISTGNVFPQLNDPRTIRNIALAATVPGTLGYAVSRMLGDKVTEKHAREFEERVREMVRAENPVISLDPTLLDETEEAELSDIGLQGPTTGKPSKAKSLVDRIAGMFRRRKASAENDFEDGALLPRKAETSWGGWKSDPSQTVDKRRMVTGDLEPGILAAIAWLSMMSGWKKGRQHSADLAEELERRRTPILENRLEQSEYDRMFGIHDPEGFARSLKKQSMADESEVMATAAMRMLSHKAEDEGLVDKAKRLIGGVRETAETGAKAAKSTFEATYPLLFAALLMGGFKIAKTMSDRSSIPKQRRKALDEALMREVEANRTPSILDVGSSLPWEKGKRGGYAGTASGDKDIRDDIDRQRLLEQREVRIG